MTDKPTPRSHVTQKQKDEPSSPPGEPFPSPVCDVSDESARAFTVAPLLRALVSRVALALEGAARVDAAAVGTEPVVLALVDVWKGQRGERPPQRASRTVLHHLHVRHVLTGERAFV